MRSRLKSAIESALMAAENVPEAFKKECFQVVLQFELASTEQMRNASGQKKENSNSGSPASHISLDDIMKEKRPQNDRQTALVIAYHIEEGLNCEATSRNDLDAAFKDVTKGNMRRITDPAQVLRDAKRDGYLDSKVRGAFFLTNKGKKLVEEELPSKPE